MLGGRGRDGSLLVGGSGLREKAPREGGGKDAVGAHASEGLMGEQQLKAAMVALADKERQLRTLRQLYGHVSSRMVRARLLHLFLFSFVTRGKGVPCEGGAVSEGGWRSEREAAPSGAHLTARQAMGDSGRSAGAGAGAAGLRFSMAAAVDAMPLELFLQVRQGGGG